MRKIIFSILLLTASLFFASCESSAAAARAPDQPAIKQAEFQKVQPLEFQTVTADFREAVPVANYQTYKILTASIYRSKEDANKRRKFIFGRLQEEFSEQEIYQPPNIWFNGLAEENSPRGKI